MGALGRALLALVAGLQGLWVSGQLRILMPESLAREFPDTHGVVYGTTATFGAPYYNERVLGQLLFGKSKTGKHHCTPDDYDMPQKDTKSFERGQEAFERAQDLVSILLVHRGTCSFTTKVRVAEEKGVHAVVVIDKEDSSLTSEQIQGVIMADDGTGGNVRIPSVLVSRFDGEKLMDAEAQGPVIIELAWGIPRGEVVIADFWMSSGSHESASFLERFRGCAEELRYHLHFVPHFHVFSLPAGTDMGNLCLDGASRFCAPDPDGPGPITGAAVAAEDLRQLCVWNTTARGEAGVASGAYYSQEFWDYANSFAHECLDSGSFDEPCSSRVMEKLGIPVDVVHRCAEQNREQFLDDQIKNVAWSPQALRLNGWRYSGPLDPETVLKAICSGYATMPEECKKLLADYTHTDVRHVAALSFSVFAWSIFCLLFSLVSLFFFYKRHVQRSVRKVLREEVMLEVQTQMSDYAQLQDSPGQDGRRTLTF